MSKERTAIGPLLVLPLMIIAPVSYGLLSLPHDSVLAMGPNGYLGFLGSLLIVIPGLTAIYLLSLRYPGQSIIQQGDTILGPFLGKIMGILYLGYNLGLLILFTRDICNLVGTYFLNRTPMFMIVLSFILVAGFLATRGIETISRTASFLLIPAMVVIFILVLAGYQNFQWTRVLPVLSDKPLNYLKGGLASSHNYYFFGIMAMVLPFLKPAKSFPKIVTGALCVVVPLYIMIAVGVVGVFGHRLISGFEWPSLELVHTIDFVYLMFEQAGLVMILDWVSMILVGSGLLYYCISLGTCQLTRKWNFKYWVCILFPIKLVLILLPTGSVQTKLIIDYITRVSWIPAFAYPLFLLGVVLLFHRKGEPSQL